MNDIRLITAEEVRENTAEKIKIKILVSEITNDILNLVKDNKNRHSSYIKYIEHGGEYSYEMIMESKRMLKDLGYGVECNYRIGGTKELIVKW